MIAVILIQEHDVCTDEWIQVVHSLLRTARGILLVSDSAQARVRHKFGLLPHTFTSQENPYVRINSLVCGIKDWVMILRPGYFVNPETVNQLIVELEACRDTGIGLGIVSVGDPRVAMPNNADLITLYFFDLFYDSRLTRPLPIWRPAAMQEALSESLFYFNERDFVLRMAQKGMHVLSLPMGLYQPCPDEAKPEYMQAMYEEELKVKEEYIRFFLSATYPVYEHMQSRLRIHAKMAQLFFKKIRAGDEHIPFEELDRQFFLFALLLAKLDNMDLAKSVLNDFFSLRLDSRNCAHLYRIFLTPSLDRFPAGHKPPTESVSPLVSVVIPLYNYGKYLDKTLASVASQTLTAWEMLIVNDGSTDHSLQIAKELLQKYNDPRMRVISKPNEGAPKTRNYGIARTSAPYICVLDADDMISSEYLTTAVGLLDKDTSAGWVNPQALVFGGNNHLTWNWGYNFLHALIKCPCPVTAVFRRDMWEALNGFKSDMSCREDWEFWMRGGEAGWHGLVTPEPMFLYRHAFARWSQRPYENFSSKEYIYQGHRWAYKNISESDKRALFAASTVGEFPQALLDPDAVTAIENCGKDEKKIRETILKLKVKVG